MHVPGWHEATRELQRSGKLQMVGIVQEQHPDRARLFMQWKRMGWPILVDPLDLLGVSVVPVTLAIDEHGVVRMVNPPLKDPARLEHEFIDRTFEKPTVVAASRPSVPKLQALERAARQGNAAALRAFADALVLWGGGRFDEAIATYARAAAVDASDAATRFRLGVAYRKRYDSAARNSGDFGKAVESWTAALDLDPNNYIWRRRIQQYGPRLDKPYPFYDWVPTARQEIRGRGETPRALEVEPGGAEFAGPAKTFEAAAPARQEPDPRGRVLRDNKGFVTVEMAVVPPVLARGGAARVHVVFRPNRRRDAHWNNEAEGLQLWVDPPEGWQVESRYVQLPNPSAAISEEVRTVEIELRAPADAASGPVRIRGYALYYVCEGRDGTCLYRRQDLEVQAKIRP